MNAEHGKPRGNLQNERGVTPYEMLVQKKFAGFAN